MSIETGVVVVAVLVGLYMAWTIGANDVANAMGTSVGSGALTLMAAIVLAGILEFAGAVLLGATVTRTVSRGIVEVSLFDPGGPLGPEGPLVLGIGMLAALLAAAVWLHVATHFRLPVSTTHSIVGAVAGVGIATFGLSGVNWATMGQIASSWVISPFMGGLLAFLSFIGIRRFILHSPDPVGATKRSSPYIVAVVVGVMVLSFIYKVLQSRMEAPPVLLALMVAVAAGGVAGAFTAALVRNTAPRPGSSDYDYVERIFALLQIGTACFVAFAHGANDVANAVGPLASVVSLAQGGFQVVSGAVTIPFWVLVLGGGGIVLGLATYGYRVIATIGTAITEVTPTRGFSAEFGAATTVLVASSMGLPISTTHTLVGGVVGVGFAQGIAALNLRIIRNIVGSWLATVPVSAIIAMILLKAGLAILL